MRVPWRINYLRGKESRPQLRYASIENGKTDRTASRMRRSPIHNKRTI
jgi:hypothetical protein